MIGYSLAIQQPRVAVSHCLHTNNTARSDLESVDLQVEAPCGVQRPRDIRLRWIALGAVSRRHRMGPPAALAFFCPESRESQERNRAKIRNLLQNFTDGPDGWSNVSN